jgi:hypothetical protein
MQMLSSCRTAGGAAASRDPASSVTLAKRTMPFGLSFRENIDGASHRLRTLDTGSGDGAPPRAVRYDDKLRWSRE